MRIERRVLPKTGFDKEVLRQMDSGEHSEAQLTLVHQNVFITMSQNVT